MEDLDNKTSNLFLAFKIQKLLIIFIPNFSPFNFETVISFIAVDNTQKLIDYYKNVFYPYQTTHVLPNEATNDKQWLVSSLS